MPGGFSNTSDEKTLSMIISGNGCTDRSSMKKRKTNGSGRAFDRSIDF